MTTYIWSDLHLGHANILNYCNRPFATVEDMDKALLKAWRTTVKGRDTIITLGDIALDKTYKFDRLKELITNLPGHKILVMGNHDRRYPVTRWREMGFDEVYPYPIIYRQWYILSHEPLFLNEKMPYLNIHGHIHNLTYNSPSYQNVSVERTHYAPLDFEALIKPRPPKQDLPDIMPLEAQLEYIVRTYNAVPEVVDRLKQLWDNSHPDRTGND